MVIEWCPALVTGNEKIDRDHQFIIAHLNQLWVELDHEVAPAIIEKALLQYFTYCIDHFSYEEEIMVRHKYKGHRAHKAEHSKLTYFFQGMLLRFEITKEISRSHFREFIEMIAAHLQSEDELFAKYIRDFY